MKRAQWQPGIHVSVIRVLGQRACERCTTGQVHDGFDVGYRKNLYHAIVAVRRGGVMTTAPAT